MAGMSTEMKIETAKQKKETADQAFKAGEVKTALRSYHESLMYLAGIDKNTQQAMSANRSSTSTDTPAKEEKTEADEIMEKIYANMAACHMRQNNWQRVVECADKALKKNPDNFKAMFRKGKALGEQGFFDKAKKVLLEQKKKNPEDAAAVDAEITRLAAIDAERTKAHKKKMKGFLSGKDLGLGVETPIHEEKKVDTEKSGDKAADSDGDEDVIELTSPAAKASLKS